MTRRGHGSAPSAALASDPFSPAEADEDEDDDDAAVEVDPDDAVEVDVEDDDEDEVDGGAAAVSSPEALTLNASVPSELVAIDPPGVT
jgi:hypothetical protein